MSKLRRSDAWATRNGITALESALQGVQRCRADVEATRNALTTGYQGSDGRAYAELIMQWEARCKKITDNLEHMINTLTTSLSEIDKNQQASNEAIRAAAAQSNSTHGSGATYNTLMGA
ncbi:hypothetical protein AB0N88_15915 [Streptomyces sp. NPDC093516]|uniref:hypothetical protein n=1 Tax=Streptomyces sp. NPDC093516 TaxID=3155304 RepID=UPI003432F23F